MTSCSLIGLAKSTLGLTYPVLVLCAPSAGELQSQVYSIQVEHNCASIEFKNHCWMLVVGLISTVQVYRFWTGIFIFSGQFNYKLLIAKEAHNYFCLKREVNLN